MNPIDAVDANIEQMIKFSVLEIISLGTKHGVFPLLARGPTIQELIDEVDLPNRRLLLGFIETLESLKIVKEKNGRLYLDGFAYTINVPDEKYDLLVPDWVPIQEEIYRMVDYAFITPIHPHVLMDFDKDADFWDIRMSTRFSRIYREAMAQVAGLRQGMHVLDIGCGSYSPLQFGEMIGYNGFYLGIDYSPALIEIARARIEDKSLPVELKEMDAKLIRPVNEYDSVFLSFVLEYIDDFPMVLKRAMEALNSGGRMVILEPFRDTFKYVQALEFFEGLNKDFIGFPSARDVKDAILNEGFDVEISQPARSMLVVKKM
ncbi:class I SAM-dependent methyltransferase [Thermococcus sp. GR7]|uniref:class I SAM-dependent methyltransferase n=1 Tax=unclassified Thermococcus TaxID=2627626 RepID=UPI0014314A28|nr:MULTISPECIES: class I SAM-dependent methyltransferase [unclassified Thermococcus]NJE47519.1 class I SAM-dependent methyltransferase [Thermococcus sp. GR7]NJE78553.1 class I SAM-dependent methyltransferase [Thermococcus sp. GR4]NJF24020.1 class I SAM-dependent methyltransferase [Thermococcus sp. GR5]